MTCFIFLWSFLYAKTRQIAKRRAKTRQIAKRRAKTRQIAKRRVFEKSKNKINKINKI
jgi:hypothetical protein